MYSTLCLPTNKRLSHCWVACVCTRCRAAGLVCSVQVFGNVWDTCLQEKRASLTRLFGTWTAIFPSQVLDKVKARMVSSSGSAPVVQPISSTQAVVAGPQPVPVPISYGMPATMNMAAGNMNMMAGTTNMLMPHAHFPGFAGFSVTVPGNAGAPMPMFVTSSGLPGVQYATGSYVLSSSQQPPAATYGLPLQPTTHANMPMLHSHIPTQAQQQMLQVGMQPVSPPHASLQQPQQYPQPTQPQPSRRSPSPLPTEQPAYPKPRPMVSKARSPLPAVNNSQWTQLQLNSLLSNLAKDGLVAPTGGSSPTEDPAIKTTEFSAAFIKVLYCCGTCCA